MTGRFPEGAEFIEEPVWIRRPGLYVSGTDTGVGKTVFACRLASLLRSRGTRVGVFKPVASGGVRRGRAVVSEDALDLRRAAGLDNVPLEQVNPLCFRAPLSPPLAARLERKRIVPAVLDAAYRRWLGRCDLLIVEGAGGVASPVTDRTLCADWAARFGLPVAIVVPARLGMIHQALAAAVVVRACGAEVAGFAVSRHRSRHRYWREDVRTIASLGRLRFLGSF